MLIEVWSDVVCPWCYVGRLRLEAALRSYEHSDEVEVVWRSFQLDPTVPVGTAEPKLGYLARKYGVPAGTIAEGLQRSASAAAAEGVQFDVENTITVNTFDAHRVLHHAATQGLGEVSHERFLRAHFVEGATLDHPTLAALAAELGMVHDEVLEVLDSGAYDREVRADIELAGQLGITGVPFFAFDRAFGLSGAQPVEVLIDAMRRARNG